MLSVACAQTKVYQAHQSVCPPDALSVCAALKPNLPPYKPSLYEQNVIPEAGLCVCAALSFKLPLYEVGLYKQNLVLTVCLCVQHLRANLPSYEVGLYEQNALTFLMYTQPELLDNAVFDISSYGLNCWCEPCGLSTTSPCRAYSPGRPVLQ